jgi:hypothetical protein
MGMGSRRHTPVILPLGMTPSTNFIEGWVDLRAGLDECGQQKVSFSQPVASSCKH